MKKTILLTLVLLFSRTVHAENYLLNGGQESRIEYTMVQELVPAPGTRKLMMSYVIPQSFSSSSYHQVIEDFDLSFSLEPSRFNRTTDKRGNRIIEAIWHRPAEAVQATISITSLNRTELDPLETDAPFPVKRLPKDVQPYLESTQMAPSADMQIRILANDLTEDSETQFDAVQKILIWIVDRLSYVLRPESYEAKYAIRTGKGNCQNYSHVAAALMRAVNIPVRIVNGITLQEPYNVRIGRYTYTLRMAQGRHSWIEVYFPDLGWVPFDPQQMQLFVSNRFIRVEIGLDNRETVADGTVRWTRSRGMQGRPSFRESIQASFLQDEVDLFAERQSYGPRKMLFTPPVEASFSRIPSEASDTAPVIIPNLDLNTLAYDKPLLYGNLDFPEGINFLDPQNVVEAFDDSTMVLHKNFLVETSEYVTTQGQKYAQTFLLTFPSRIEKVSLALRKFGGSGQCWIEIYNDDDGRPGNVVSTSDFLSLEMMPIGPGYGWIDFQFSGNPLLLAPGRYWIALAYTGSPIINWFFTYGKTVGPVDGTRYNTVFDENWGHALTYEFNYRIIGMRANP